MATALAVCLVLLDGAPARAADGEAAAPDNTSPATAVTGETAPASAASSPVAGASTTDAAPAAVAPGGDLPFDPDFNPGLDTAMPAVPASAAGKPRPDYKPPAIDAYVDLALTDADVSSFTYRKTANGYRFIVGFRLEEPVYDRLHIAPEVGYLRIGRVQSQQSVSTNNIPIPQYVNTATTTRVVDMSALQFDVRGSYPLFGPVEGYARVGMHVYHLERTSESINTYTPIPPNTTPRDPDTQDSNSITDVGSGLFGTVGIACSLGKVPSLFAEYGSYRIGSGNLNVAAFGFLLNF